MHTLLSIPYLQSYIIYVGLVCLIAGILYWLSRMWAFKKEDPKRDPKQQREEELYEVRKHLMKAYIGMIKYNEYNLFAKVIEEMEYAIHHPEHDLQPTTPDEFNSVWNITDRLQEITLILNSLHSNPHLKNKVDSDQAMVAFLYQHIQNKYLSNPSAPTRLKYSGSQSGSVSYPHAGPQQIRRNEDGTFSYTQDMSNGDTLRLSTEDALNIISTKRNP